MAELSAAAPAGVAASERDVLLATKLHVPRPRPGLVAAQPGDGELLLVLDDYHLIDTQQVHDSLVFLLEHLPPGLHLVLASRSDPPLPLARLRAGAQLAELRTGDLRFTAEEAAALLRETAGDVLPTAAVAALAARTEGWAAGLQLAALSLRGQP